ncbi:MAG: hypothetical protein H0W62_13320 [Chitinophagales bacterium]|nr:hypothetical protein [Chitinophagales bacterium]
MKDKVFSSQFIILCLIILCASLSRLLSNQLHLWNFTPIAAMALFSGASFREKKYAFLVPLIAMVVTDFIIGFHPGIWDVYGAFAIITVIGIYLRNRVSVPNIILASLVSSLLFFFITNFFVWLGAGLYTQDAQGLGKCFAEGIPFFGNTIAGDLFYCGVLFGGYELLKKTNPSIIKV